MPVGCRGVTQLKSQCRRMRKRYRLVTNRARNSVSVCSKAHFGTGNLSNGRVYTYVRYYHIVTIII